MAGHMSDQVPFKVLECNKPPVNMTKTLGEGSSSGQGSGVVKVLWVVASYKKPIIESRESYRTEQQVGESSRSNAAKRFKQTMDTELNSYRKEIASLKEYVEHKKANTKGLSMAKRKKAGTSLRLKLGSLFDPKSQLTLITMVIRVLRNLKS